MRKLGIRLATLVLLFFSAAVYAEAPYSMKVWGYQGRGNRAVDAHTFVSFYQGEELAGTISWLPAGKVVHRFGAEKGHNFPLAETLKMAKTGHKQVKFWGPYKIKPELYNRAMTQIQYLESGAALYSMTGFRADAPNCIQAAGSIGGPMYPNTTWGFAASQKVVKHLSPWIVH